MSNMSLGEMGSSKKLGGGGCSVTKWGFEKNRFKIYLKLKVKLSG